MYVYIYLVYLFIKFCYLILPSIKLRNYYMFDVLLEEGFSLVGQLYE